VLSVISKVFEKHITYHLFGYLNKYKLIHRAQSGFRKHHSCQTALLKLIDSWLDKIDKGETIGAIFFDLRKAFDLVNHDLLLLKLEAYKFSKNTLEFFRSYLHDRKQCTVSGNIKSNFDIVTAGVPQGSVLGPVLFLMFINDLPLYMNNSDIDLFADDTTVYNSNNEASCMQNELQEDANNFQNWCQQNIMFTNKGKSSTMQIGTQQKLSKTNEIEIIIENEKLKSTTNQKLLGVQIDSNLSWNAQVEETCKKVTRKITLLKQLSKYVPRSSLQIFYNSYILPIFDYGITVWGHTSDYNIDRLTRLQKRAARIILKAHYLTPSTQMFKELKWQPIRDRIKFHSATMVYKSLNGRAPEYMNDLLKVIDNSVRTRSMTQKHLEVPRSNKKIHEGSFSVYGPKLWNELPLEIRDSKTVQSFKNKLRQHLEK
jgi:hypothetical protein